MRLGWEAFIRHRDPEYLLVFNDDVYFYPGAIAALLNAGSELESTGWDAYAVAGAMKDPDTGEPTYGGVVRDRMLYPISFAKIRPSDTIVACHTLNMNLALISRGALQRIGFLSPEFTQRKADFDFGLRLRNAGGKVVMAPGYLGECQRNSVGGTSWEEGIGLAERWRRLTGIKEHPPRERLSYCRRHGGRLWPGIWAAPYIHVVAMHGVNRLKRAILRRNKQAEY
jgi:GT2 family glycosyltransferase